MGKSGQIYSHHQAMTYRNIPGLSGSDDPVESTINRWLKARLDAGLPNSGIVGDIGCGNGRLFPILEGNAAISSSVAICFPDPNTLISAIAPVMAPSARLFLASNIFVDSTIADKVLSTLAGEGFVGPTIDIFDPSFIKELPPAHSQFRHVLYTRAAKVPLQDHVHDIAMYVRAFPRDLWRIEEARLFRPDGCEHVFSDTDASEFDQGPRLFLEPNAPFFYPKIGIIARRLG